jgi:hypothetical protein
LGAPIAAAPALPALRAPAINPFAPGKPMQPKSATSSPFSLAPRPNAPVPALTSSVATTAPAAVSAIPGASSGFSFSALSLPGGPKAQIAVPATPFTLPKAPQALAAPAPAPVTPSAPSPTPGAVEEGGSESEGEDEAAEATPSSTSPASVFGTANTANTTSTAARRKGGKSKGTKGKPLGTLSSFSLPQVTAFTGVARIVAHYLLCLERVCLLTGAPVQPKPLQVATMSEMAANAVHATFTAMLWRLGWLPAVEKLAGTQALTQTRPTVSVTKYAARAPWYAVIVHKAKSLHTARRFLWSRTLMRSSMSTGCCATNPFLTRKQLLASK